MTQWDVPYNVRDEKKYIPPRETVAVLASSLPLQGSGGLLRLMLDEEGLANQQR
jgi:hypothetical protein